MADPPVTFNEVFESAKKAVARDDTMTQCIEVIFGLRSLGVLIVRENDELDVDFAIYRDMLEAVGEDGKVVLDELLATILSLNRAQFKTKLN